MKPRTVCAHTPSFIEKWQERARVGGACRCGGRFCATAATTVAFWRSSIPTRTLSSSLLSTLRPQLLSFPRTHRRRQIIFPYFSFKVSGFKVKPALLINVRLQPLPQGGALIPRFRRRPHRCSGVQVQVCRLLIQFRPPKSAGAIALQPRPIPGKSQREYCNGRSEYAIAAGRPPFHRGVRQPHRQNLLLVQVNFFLPFRDGHFRISNNFWGRVPGARCERRVPPPPARRFPVRGWAAGVLRERRSRAHASNIFSLSLN